jgi:hypothetical protein
MTHRGARGVTIAPKGEWHVSLEVESVWREARGKKLKTASLSIFREHRDRVESPTERKVSAYPRRTRRGAEYAGGRPCAEREGKEGA